MNRGRHTARGNAAQNGPTLFEIIVGNVGTVHKGSDEIEANEFFDIYAALSAAGEGRVADESVTLWHNGEPERQFIGAADVLAGWQEAGYSRVQIMRLARFGDWDNQPRGFKHRLMQLVDRAYRRP